MQKEAAGKDFVFVQLKKTVGRETIVVSRHFYLLTKSLELV